MSMMTKLNCDQIKEGVRFSDSVYFDDGVNMFLAKGHSAKKYHVAALKRWNIPFLVTSGHIITEAAKPAVFSGFSDDDVGELEAL